MAMVFASSLFSSRRMVGRLAFALGIENQGDNEPTHFIRGSAIRDQVSLTHRDPELLQKSISGPCLRKSSIVTYKSVLPYHQRFQLHTQQPNQSTQLTIHKRDA
jgi:hypothetical protein